MLTGLSTLTTPLVDSQVTGNSSVTLDTAASPSDICSHSAAGRLPHAEQGLSEVRAVLVGVRSEPRSGSSRWCRRARTSTSTTSPGANERTTGPSSSAVVDLLTADGDDDVTADASPAAWPGPLACKLLTSAPGRSTSSPRMENTVNSSTMAISMCISEPAEITSIRRG